jgi:hypothetical protein
VGHSRGPPWLSDLSGLPGLSQLFRYARFVWFGGSGPGGGALLLYRAYMYIGGIVVHMGQGLVAVRFVRFVVVCLACPSLSVY